MRSKCQPTPVVLPGKFHGQRSLADYRPRDFKESDMAERQSTAQWLPKGIIVGEDGRER